MGKVLDFVEEVLSVIPEERKCGNVSDYLVPGNKYKCQPSAGGNFSLQVWNAAGKKLPIMTTSAALTQLIKADCAKLPVNDQDGRKAIVEAHIKGSQILEGEPGDDGKVWYTIARQQGTGTASVPQAAETFGAAALPVGLTLSSSMKRLF